MTQLIPLNPLFAPHEYNGLTQVHHRASALNDGSWAVAWTERDASTLGSDEVFFRVFDASGAPLVDAIQVNTYTVDNQTFSDIMTLADGSFVVVWSSYGQETEFQSSVHYRHFAEDGTPLSEERLAYSDQAVLGQEVRAASLKDGGFVISWMTTEDGYPRYHLSFDSELNPIYGPELVAGSDFSFSYASDIVGLASGGWVISWVGTGPDPTRSVYQAVFDSDGNAVGAPSMVNTRTASDPPGTTNSVFYSTLGTLNDGGWIVAWVGTGLDGEFDQDADIYMQRFASDGTPVGVEMRVNDYEPFQQQEPDVIGLPDGGWIVAWHDEAAPDGTKSTAYERRIMGQRYDEDGDRVDDNFALSDMPAFREQYPDIELLTDGRILHTWWTINYQGDDSRADILQQVLIAPTEGTNGSDSLVGYSSIDYIFGKGGNDSIEGGGGSDSLDGGDDNDELFGGGSGEDTLIGGRGSDFLFGENGDDLLEGGDGFDLLNGGTDDDTLLGGNGNDRLLGNLGNDSLEGDAGNDTLFGGPSGNDILKGGDNDDQLFGETGKDILFGEDGNDTLNGGSNDDTLLGGNGDDSLEGGSGNDQLFGGPTGADTLKGGQGSDFLFAESADDVLEGGDGFDLMNGGAGDDLMLGGNGGDRLEGNLGEDTLDGGAGDDELFGGNGIFADTLIGGTGNDTLFGEQGADTFVFEDGFGVDEIRDFSLAGGDVIDLALVGGITSFTDLQTNHLSQDGADAVITDGANTIRLVGIDENDLAAGDFDFGV